MGFINEALADIRNAFSAINGEYPTDREWQKQMQDNQNAFNVRMWNLNNEYNSPQSQIKRLMEAGISRSGAVSMLTGGTSAGPVTASNMPSAPNQNRVPQMLATILGGIKEMSLLKTTKDNIEANTRKTIADAARSEQTLTFDIDLLKKQGNYLDKQMDEISTNMQLTDAQRKNWDILNKWADKKEEAELKNMIEAYKETQEKIRLLQEQNKDLHQDVIKKEWENFYRSNFGVDPNSGPMNMLITSTLKGDMDSVFNAFEKGVNTVFTHLKGIAETGYNHLKNAFNNSNTGQSIISLRNRLGNHPIRNATGKMLFGKNYDYDKAIEREEYKKYLKNGGKVTFHK